MSSSLLLAGRAILLLPSPLRGGQFYFFPPPCGEGLRVGVRINLGWG